MLAHVITSFEIDVSAPMAEAMPLFGADRERVWAKDWEPQFVYPDAPGDRAGMVFQVAHGHASATWVATQFDLARGTVQYVYIVPGAMTALITIHATAHGNRTHVTVTYERTALDAAANDHVRALAEADKTAGPEWSRDINAYLARAHAITR
jgi:hypothetical protein